ncbi:MAG: hypothetical protein AB8B61_06105 [Cyclobacteriaceae bacterium]
MYTSEPVSVFKNASNASMSPEDRFKFYPFNLGSKFVFDAEFAGELSMSS